MTNKKKQSAVVVAATVMSITFVLSPVAAVYAADAETAIVQQTRSTEIRENALPVTLPQELSGNAGQVLQDIALPDGWSWTDGNTIISREKPEYPARTAVDDKTYDYSAVEGYNAEEHFVEKNIPVTVLVPETEESTALSAKEQVQAPQTDSISSNTGEIEINPTSTEARENAPLITLPQELSGNDGQALQDIALPDGWSWTDGNTIISKEKPEYPARIAVDDKTYDYSAVEGYNAEEHFVEKNIPVTVLVPETEESTALFAKEQVQAPQANSISSNTGKVEINSTDFPDEKFREYLLDKFNGDGENKIAIADVTLIDVKDRTDITDLKGIEKFADLKYLICSYTGIQALDVSKNSNLETLSCTDTEIQDLDVSKNSNLKRLYCSNTEIQALNVSKNTALTYLFCPRTKIQALDVSNCPDLEFLDTRYMNLAYLDWGTADLSTWSKTLSTIDLTVTGDTFDITKKFAGIDISKLTVISGGRLDGNNITDYKVGTPIQYTYACGNVNGSSDTLTVTLNLSKSVSKIEITSNPDMTYTGNPVKNPSVDSEGSTGDVNYTYEIWNGRIWDKYTGIPTNAGKYRVTAKLAEDDFYKGAEDTKEFTISQAANGWTEDLAMTDWTYGDKAVSPTAKAIFGDVIFTYSDSEKEAYTDVVPTDAGTWYVKAAVAGTDNYTALEATKEFTVSQATNGWTEDLVMTGWTYGDKAVSPTAKAIFGDVIFTYSDSEKGAYTDAVPTDAGTWYVKAAVTGTDNFTGVESTKEFTISQAANGWTEDLAITGWTYGEKAVSPTAKAIFGDVIFTYSDSEKEAYTDVVPTDAGTWYVKAAVAGTDNYTALEATKEFTVSQATNGWTEDLVMTGWTYGDKAVSPTAKAIFGDVIFTYSDSEKGAYTDAVPTDAGTWYVKAAVTGTDNFTGVESTKEFTISQATNGWTENLAITGWTYGEKAVSPTAKAIFGNVIFTYSDSEK
ncbi:leucine-rich repeat domain-containing protein, partial [Murimonas intestini]